MTVVDDALRPGYVQVAAIRVAFDGKVLDHHLQFSEGASSPFVLMIDLSDQLRMIGQIVDRSLATTT